MIFQYHLWSPGYLYGEPVGQIGRILSARHGNISPKFWKLWIRLLRVDDIQSIALKIHVIIQHREFANCFQSKYWPVYWLPFDDLHRICIFLLNWQGIWTKRTKQWVRTKRKRTIRRRCRRRRRKRRRRNEVDLLLRNLFLSLRQVGVWIKFDCGYKLDLNLNLSNGVEFHLKLFR